MESKVKLSVVIPVYNSEESIGLLVEELGKVLENRVGFEVILVDDYSRDNSYRVCRGLAEKHKFVKFISLSKNFGQENATMAGFRYADGEYILCMDDDLQNPPEGVIPLLEEIERGYDVVYATYTQCTSIVRRFYSKLNDIMAGIMTEKPHKIHPTSLFIIRRFVAKEVMKYTGPYPYLEGLIFRCTSNYSTIPIKHCRRRFGRSNYTFLKLFGVWLNGFTSFSVKPLRVSMIVGSVISLSGFIFALVLIHQKLSNPEVPMGWTSLMSALLFIGGLNILMLGLVGEYVGRTFVSLNKQPQAVVRETYNTEKKAEDGSNI